MSRRRLEPVQSRLKHLRSISGDLRPEHITDALHEARSIIFEYNEAEFISRESIWLRSHLPSLCSAIDSMRSPNYIAARTGGYLGAAVLRIMTQEEPVDETSCQTNLLTWQLGARSIAPSSTWDTEQLTELYGAANAQALDQIKDLVSKTACAIVIALPLTPYG